MSKSKTRTWAQLYERLGRQPLNKMKESRIMLKEEDGIFTPLILKYGENGVRWWFEKADL